MNAQNASTAVKGDGVGVASDAEEKLGLPVVSLQHFSQDELLLLAKAQGCRLADTYFSMVVNPDLDRRLFNESVGSKQQTYRNWEDYWPKKPESKEEEVKRDGATAGEVKQQQPQEGEDDEQVGRRKLKKKTEQVGRRKLKKKTNQQLINRPPYSEKRKKLPRNSPHAEPQLAEVVQPKRWTSPRRALASETNCAFLNTGMAAVTPAVSEARLGPEQLAKGRRGSRFGSIPDSTLTGDHGGEAEEKLDPSQVEEDEDEGASVPVTIIPSGRVQGFAVPFEIRAVREDFVSDDGQVTTDHRDSNLGHMHEEPLQIERIAPSAMDSEIGNMDLQVKMIAGSVHPHMQLAHPNLNFMPIERDAALSETAPDLSNTSFEIPRGASNLAADVTPEPTIPSMERTSGGTFAFVEMATAADSFPVEIAKETGDMRFMPIERDAALTETALDLSNTSFEIPREDSNSAADVDPEQTISSMERTSGGTFSFVEMATAADSSSVEIATETGDMRWHLRDSEVSAAPVVSSSDFGCVCVQCEADLASVPSVSEHDDEDSLRQAEVNAAAIASGLCTSGWMKNVVLEATTETSAEMGCMTSGLYHLEMNAVSGDTSYDSSDTNLGPLDPESNDIAPINEGHMLQPEAVVMDTVTAHQNRDSDCMGLLGRHGDGVSDDCNVEEGNIIPNNPLYHTNVSTLNNTQATGVEPAPVASAEAEDGGILLLERFIQMMSQGHPKEYSKPKLESRGGKKLKLATALQEYRPLEKTQSKRFTTEVPTASYLDYEERSNVHCSEEEQRQDGSDTPPPLEACTVDTYGVRESTESIGETLELERNTAAPLFDESWHPGATWVATEKVDTGEPEKLQLPGPSCLDVAHNPPPAVSWEPPVPQQSTGMGSAMSSLDPPCESGLKHEAFQSDQHDQETCKDGTDQVSNLREQTQCTAANPSSPPQPKLKAEMERRLAAIEGKWLTDKRKVVVADNFPEGWTVCVFLRTKGGRATLEYRSWKSPEGKVFGTFKDAAEYVQSTTGVMVKNRGLLKTEQAREKKTVPPGREVASYPPMMHDCRICESRFTSEVDLMQHKRVHDLSYTELVELSQMQKLEAQRAAPAGTGLLSVTGLPSVIGVPSLTEVSSVAVLPSVTGLPNLERPTSLEVNSGFLPSAPSLSNAGTQNKEVISCSICSGTFSCKKNLRRHMQRRHPDNQSKGLSSTENPLWSPEVQSVQSYPAQYAS